MLAALVAGASSFLLGGVWYSPAVFGRLWGCEAGIAVGEQSPGEERQPPRQGVRRRDPARAALRARVRAGGSARTRRSATPLKSGGVVGLAFVATCFGVNYAFASRSALMWAIDAGYHVVQFLIFGLVLGLWH